MSDHTEASSAGVGAVPRMAFGFYVGDDAAIRAIVGIGFKPKVVKVYAIEPGAGATNDMAVKCDVDGLNAWAIDHGGGGADYAPDIIISLDADGFTVGDSTGLGNNLVNELNTHYEYVCWE